MDVDNGRMRRPAPAGFFQRLRRLVEEANHPLRLERTAIRAVLVLLALAATIALGAVAWFIYLDSRSAAVTITDPREAYVSRVRERMQAATDAVSSEGPRQSRAGSLVLRIVLNPDGKVISARVKQSSGDPALDDLALRIVRESEPLEPFPPEVRNSTKVIEIISTFNFK